MGQKRNELMIAEDRAKVCELLLRGYTSKAEMASIINSGRDIQNHITRNQIAQDITWMKNKYLEQGLESLELYQKEGVGMLMHLMKTYYQGYEESRGVELTIEDEDIVDSDTYEEMGFLAEQGEDFDIGANKKVKTKKRYRKEGNVAFLNGAKSCIDAINKMRGVDGANKIALTDPSGTQEFSGVLEMMKHRMDELAEDKSVDIDLEAKLLGEPKKDDEEEDFIDAEFIDEIENDEVGVTYE